jgi:hypothetical protein
VSNNKIGKYSQLITNYYFGNTHTRIPGLPESDVLDSSGSIVVDVLLKEF